MTFNKRRQRGLAGACAAALLAGGVVRAQTTTDRAVAPAAGVPVVAGPDARVRIAHGLAMAIEGSTLQELAVQSGRAAAVPGTTGAAGNVPAGVPRVGEAGTGTLGSPAGSAGSGVSTYGRDLSPAGPGATAAGGTTTPARERQNPLPVNPEAIAPGSTEKLPGVGVTGRNGARATTSASFNAIAPSGRPGADSGAVAGRMAAALSAQPEQLMQEARLSFEASDNLLRAVDDSSPATERFRLAAERYARSLRTMGGMPAGAEAAGENRAARTAMNGSDRATLALINHAVKEASDSLQIKQLVRLSAGDSTASRALMDHARKMDAGSRQTIESLAPADENGRRVGSTFSGRGGPGGITLLAQEARQVLDAIRELDSLDGRPAGGRPAVSPSPGTVDPSTTPAASGDVRPPR